MDSREELQSFLTDVYKLIPTLHATTRRISGVKALLYMKRDKARQDLLHLKENLNAYIQKLEMQVDAVTQEKEEYLQTLLDGIFAQGICLSRASESAEQLLEYGREDHLSSSYEKLMNDFASVISATPNVNIELGCCLKFIPNIDVTANRSAIGYIRYMDLDPADLKVSCDVTKALVGKVVEGKIFFTKTPSDAALQYLDVSVVDENVQPIRFSLAKSLRDVLSFNFTPQQSGEHMLCVRLYDVHAVNSPYCIHVEEFETGKRYDDGKPKLGGQTVESYKMPSTCDKQRDNRQNKDSAVTPYPSCDIDMSKVPSIETGKLSFKPSGRKCATFQSIEMYKPPSPTCEQTTKEDTRTRKERTVSSPREPRINLSSKVIVSSTSQSSKKVDRLSQETSNRSNNTNVQSRMINFHLKPSKMQSKAANKTKKPVSSTKTSECLVSNRFHMSNTSTTTSSTTSNLNESQETAIRDEVSQWTPKSHKDRAKNSLTKSSVDKCEVNADLKSDNSVSHNQHENTGKECDNDRNNHELYKSTISNAIVKDHQLGSEETSFYVNLPEEWELVDTDELFKLDVQSISCYEERKRKTGRQDSGFYEKDSSPIDQLSGSNQGTSSVSNHEVLIDDHLAGLTIHKSPEATECEQVIVNDNESRPVSEKISVGNDEQRMVSMSATTVLSDVVKESNSKFASKCSSSVKSEHDFHVDANNVAENCKQDVISPAMKCISDGNSTVEDIPGDIAGEDVELLQDVTDDIAAVQHCDIMLGSMSEVDMQNVKEMNKEHNGDCNGEHQEFKQHVESISRSGYSAGAEFKVESIFEDCTVETFASEFVDELLKKIHQDLCNETILINDNVETQTNLAEVNLPESTECNKVLSIPDGNTKKMHEIPTEDSACRAMLLIASRKKALTSLERIHDIHDEITVENEETFIDIQRDASRLWC